METRSKSLDMLRAVAILLVLGSHITIADSNILFIKSITTVWKRGGWVGVDLFFVLSGFLISGLLFREHKRFGFISLRRFFIRRGFKIYPAFYTMVLLITLLLAFRHYMSSSLKSLIPWLFYLQNYMQPEPQYVLYWRHTWSLAVEEQFYVFLPVLIIFLSRINRSRDNPFKSIPVIFAFICLACLGLRTLKSITYPYESLDYFGFHLRIDSLFFGVLISYFYHYYPLRFKELTRSFRYLLLGVGIILLIPPFIAERHNTPFIYTAGYTFFYIGSGLILIALVEKEFKTNLFTKTAASIGFYSYSIYLWHLPLSRFSAALSRRLPAYLDNWFIYAAGYMIGAILVGIFMARIIEIPLLGLRDRLFPSRSKISF